MFAIRAKPNPASALTLSRAISNAVDQAYWQRIPKIRNYRRMNAFSRAKSFENSKFWMHDKTRALSIFTVKKALRVTTNFPSGKLALTIRKVMGLEAVGIRFA